MVGFFTCFTIFSVSRIGSQRLSKAYLRCSAFLHSRISQAFSRWLTNAFLLEGFGRYQAPGCWASNIPGFNSTLSRWFTDASSSRSTRCYQALSQHREITTSAYPVIRVDGSLTPPLWRVSEVTRLVYGVSGVLYCFLSGNYGLHGSERNEHGWIVHALAVYPRLSEYALGCPENRRFFR